MSASNPRENTRLVCTHLKSIYNNDESKFGNGNFDNVIRTRQPGGEVNGDYNFIQNLGGKHMLIAA